MEHVEELPTIYGVEKNGKTKSWTARIYRDMLNGNATAEIVYGQLDGKKQTTTREYTEGKNLGKKNETTPLQQCMSETRRKWQDKMEKEGYSLVPPVLESESTPSQQSQPTSSSSGGKVFPMLAHAYEPLSSKNKKNDIVFPCYVQPKLDGLRCVCYMMPCGNDCKVVAQSRTGAYFETVEHICDELRPVLLKNPGLVLDGELYTTDIPFEELAGLIKRKKASDADVQQRKCIKYHVYDIVVDGAPYSERHKHILATIGRTECEHVEVVHTQLIHTVGEFRQAFGEYIASGYEGIMLRNVHGPYRQNYRSHDLQKYKEFVESEYPIVGFKEAEGRDKGTVVWVCRTAEEREFSVRPRGTQEQRRQWFQDGHAHVGKLLTVIYQELSELNVPRFPVGKAIRDGY